MLHHVSVGVRDLERATNFYDAVLGTLGYHRVMEVVSVAVAYGVDQPTFWVQLPHNQQVATAGNGTHISFIARTPEAVDAFYAAALELGAQNAGEPGPRPDYSPDYYCAFVYDLDGNKLEAALLEQPEELPVPAKKPARKAAKKAVTKKAAKPLAKKSVKKVAKKAAPKAAVKAVKKAKKKVARVIQVIAVPKPSKGKKPAKAPKKAKGGKKDKKDKKDKKNKRTKA
jgi:catechol 2,3-dioxygenase-like lactoylglutathione lyase family enzyme